MRGLQSLFTLHVALLITYVNSLGHELTFGNTTAPTGFSGSLHPKRLAIDLNLFIDGAYQRSSKAYEPLGRFWKSLHPDNAWGGDFTPRDGNHFSHSYGGHS